MKINVFADTICGWCFIGHRNLNTALKKFPEIKFDIKHVPFQLNPDMLTEGISRDKYLEIKFGGKDYATPMYENMRLKGNESGINLNLFLSLLPSISYFHTWVPHNLFHQILFLNTYL